MGLLPLLLPLPRHLLLRRRRRPLRLRLRRLLLHLPRGARWASRRCAARLLRAGAAGRRAQRRPPAHGLPPPLEPSAGAARRTAADRVPLRGQACRRLLEQLEAHGGRGLRLLAAAEYEFCLATRDGRGAVPGRGRRGAGTAPLPTERERCVRAGGSRSSAAPRSSSRCRRRRRPPCLHLPVSPSISPYLPVSAPICPYQPVSPVSPRISSVSPRIFPYLVSPGISRPCHRAPPTRSPRD